MRALLFVAAAALVVSLVVLGIFVIRNQGRASPSATRKGIMALWEKGSYREVFDLSDQGLVKRPMDSFFLTMSGLAAHYLGAAQISDEDRLGYMRTAVSRLRKALVMQHPPYAKEIRYVIGKSYFHLGYYYLDEAVSFLEAARALGLSAADVDEYLAMAYYHLGSIDKSIAAFESAMAYQPTDQLYVTAALAYGAAGRTADAEEALRKAIAITNDIAVGSEARFRLSDILIAQKRYVEAEEAIQAVLDKDPDSADARYRLGLLYEALGDPAKARSEWRKAVKSDPMHQGARLKLSEKK
jgi:tetratricopeptide (TPR) repeat protein